MGWEELDQKYSLTPAPADQSSDPWAALDAKHLSFLQKPEAQKPERVTDFKGNLQFASPFGTLDTGIPLPQFLNKGLAQFGSGVADWGLGLDQMRGKAPQGAAEVKRATDAQLNEDWAGKGLHFAGKVAPALAVPGIGGAAGMIGTGALAGGLSGLFEPTAQGESRGMNTAVGAGLGGILPGHSLKKRSINTGFRSGSPTSRTIGS